MKKWLMVVVLGVCLQGGYLSARTFSETDPVILDIKEHIRMYKAAPTPENRFELAMAFGYNGFIEQGWKILKRVPKSYAPEVVRKYEALSAKNPTNPHYPFRLAFGYYFLGQKEAAKGAFRRVLEIDSKQVWAMGFTALVEGEEKHNDAAIAWCKKALLIDKDATAIHFLLAEGYRRTGNYMGVVGEMLTVGRLKTQEKISGIDFEDTM